MFSLLHSSSKVKSRKAAYTCSNTHCCQAEQILNHALLLSSLNTLYKHSLLRSSTSTLFKNALLLSSPKCSNTHCCAEAQMLKHKAAQQPKRSITPNCTAVRSTSALHCSAAHTCSKHPQLHSSTLIQCWHQKNAHLLLASTNPISHFRSHSTAIQLQFQQTRI